MKRIAVTKPEMGVLDHRRPSLSPFGVLAQTFAQEVLARSAWEEGIWPAVPLALLEEEEEHAPPTLPPKVTLQMDLRLVLEALRRQDSQGVQEKTMERIVERVLERQSSRTEGRKAKEKIPDKAGVPSLTVLGTIHQSFQQHLTQALRVELGQAGAAQRRWTPGRLARQTEAFSRRLQSLREEGGPVGENASLPQGRALRVPEGETRTLEHAGVQEAQPQYTIQTAALPAQALEYLQERGDEAAQETLSGQTAALLRQGKELERRLREAGKPGQHREETQPGARPPQTPTGPNRAAQPPQELPERTSGETGGAPPCFPCRGACSRGSAPRRDGRARRPVGRKRAAPPGHLAIAHRGPGHPGGGSGVPRGGSLPPGKGGTWPPGPPARRTVPPDGGGRSGGDKLRRSAGPRGLPGDGGVPPPGAAPGGTISPDGERGDKAGSPARRGGTERRTVRGWDDNGPFPFGRNRASQPLAAAYHCP